MSDPPGSEKGSILVLEQTLGCMRHASPTALCGSLCNAFLSGVAVGDMYSWIVLPLDIGTSP